MRRARCSRYRQCPGARTPGRRPSHPRGANLHASAPQTPAPLGLRHAAALEQLRGGPITISELASRLDLTLPTVSGVLADLDRVLDQLAPSEQAAFLKAMDLLETELRTKDSRG